MVDQEAILLTKLVLLSLLHAGKSVEGRDDALVPRDIHEGVAGTGRTRTGVNA